MGNVSFRGRRTGAFWIFAALCVGLPSMVFGAEAGKTEVGTVTLVATGFASEKGEVLVSLADSRDNYESDDGGFRKAAIKASGGTATTTFESLPYGEYAIKIFHDENSNEEFDIGWTGPEERYGFSNDARGMMGPPDWDEVKFSLAQPALTVNVTVE